MSRFAQFQWVGLGHKGNAACRAGEMENILGWAREWRDREDEPDEQMDVSPWLAAIWQDVNAQTALKVRVGKLEHTVRSLQDELAEIRQASAKRDCSVLAVIEHAAVLACTREIFQHAKVAISEGTDPENGDESYFVVAVESKDGIDAIIAKHAEWHREVLKVAPKSAVFYRLTLDAQ